MSDKLLTPKVADRLRRVGLTYPEVGQTAGPLPDGYFWMAREAQLGTGAALFHSSANLLFAWELQRRAGVRVRPSSPTVHVGAVAVLLLGVGPFALRAPVRVVTLVDEPTRRGFAYGTLPGHPESGEEQFLVELLSDGTVVCRITAFSRPASWMTRLGGPVARATQHWVTTRYLRSLNGAYSPAGYRVSTRASSGIRSR